MYIGRIVSVFMTPEGNLGVGYRVSSRSFPNRTASLAERRISIIPRPGHEADLQKNPYIAYNAVRIVCDGEVAVATNGSQTDPIAEKLESGMNARDAIAFSSLVMDYEKDDYNTPRVSAVVDAVDKSAWLGIVRHDGIEVRQMPLEEGRFFYVATYEENFISEALGGETSINDAAAACQFMLSGGIFADRSHGVTAASAVQGDEGFSLAAADAPE